MQVARFGHAVVERPSGELLVMGGTNDQGSHALVEVYEPRPRRWVFVPRPQDKTFDEWHAVALLQSGGALVSGGAPRENGQTFVHPKRDAMWLNSELGVLESLPPMNDGRAEHTLTTLQSGHIRAVGGWDELDTRFSNKRPKSWAELFEPLVGRWSRTEPMTGVRFAHTATLLPSGKVLVVGGMGAKQLTNHIPSFQNVSLKDAELYDPDSRSWSPAGQMEDLRAHHTATLLGPGPLEGKVLVTGGQSKPETGRAGTPLATVELYHPDTGLWEKKKSMPVPLEKHTATLLLDGRVLVVGGKTSFLYQPASGSEGTWSTTGSLSHSRSEHMALRLPDGRVLVAGGGSTALEVYDPGKGTWSILEVEGALPSIPRTATLLPSGEVFVTGSQWDASRGLYADAYAALARRALGGWRSGESLPTRHDRHVAAVLQDGQLLVVGNTTAQLHDPATGRWMDAASPGSTQPCDSATVLQDGRVLVVKRGATELYVPTGTWQTAGLARPMVNNLREGHTATLLPKGHVLVAGGGLNPNTVELYDPQQDTWTPLSPMKKARSNHRAVLLPHAGAEGKVLVVGGMSGSTYLGAEVYDIKANTWMELAAIPVGHLLSVTLLPTGLVLVVGHNDTQSVCGLYDPVTELWRDTRFKPLHTYQDHGATLLPSGRVLLTGGRLNTGQAELFDPTSEAWLPAGALAVPRFAHSALLLPSTGRVLVVGGLVRGPNGATNPATPTAQVELYDELGTRDSWRSGAALPG
jgi:WD40 repeat protein